MNQDLLFLSGKSVFTIQDILLSLQTNHPQTVRNFLQRMKKKGILQPLHYGIRGLKKYDLYELASKLKTNSYISCETVLKEAGIIFQYYGSTITCISDNTLSKKVNGHTFLYRKITSRIRLEPEGIEQHTYYAVATPERALCDMIYLSPDMTFDDLSGIDLSLVKYLARHYPSRVLSHIKQLTHDR